MNTYAVAGLTQAPATSESEAAGKNAHGPHLGYTGAHSGAHFTQVLKTIRFTRLENSVHDPRDAAHETSPAENLGQSVNPEPKARRGPRKKRNCSTVEKENLPRLPFRGRRTWYQSQQLPRDHPNNSTDPPSGLHCVGT
ncbi:hypothetical protein N7468_005877 [Penicillium chermesinum]|uniref:Uncharacterized protein n=1 Tax=Penicillium chermesinum TaxID=63820 RepID=A0A9W9P003_9EURO|nr:uncharacterized protein N7468_005877 [Penicillium chermesinum]KAJ5232921.1 hypothetical protein N7468_005877 [Penicillium chermesinum]KAJ6172572.1 hypothetical protein N7470_001639 [Penicillium chermesinum]